MSQQYIIHKENCYVTNIGGVIYSHVKEKVIFVIYSNCRDFKIYVI